MSAPVGSNRLPVLAESIREASRALTAAANDAAENALSAGMMLCEAKALCRHGEWLPFLAEAGVVERSAQRWMRLHRAGFTSAMVADLGFHVADSHASAWVSMAPRDGYATEACGWDQDEQSEGLFYWWREDEWIQYWGANLLRGDAFQIGPRRMRPWLVGAVHAPERSRFDRYVERESPILEARAFVASLQGVAA